MSKVLELTKELISKKSVTPDDAGCQSIISTRLKKIGFSDIETNGILGNNWYNFYKTI